VCGSHETYPAPDDWVDRASVIDPMVNFT
jgi:hypothetical protein